MPRVFAVTTALVLALTGSAQATTKPPSCTRGHATLEQSAAGVRIVRIKVKRQSKQETRHENVLACWTATGRRMTIAQEVDFGLDNIASTRVEIVQGRYAGVVETNEGGVSIGVAARVYDVKRRRLLHDASACDKLDRGDYAGPDDVAFLDDGGLAFACDQLVLYRSAKAPAEQLEPVGTDVRQLAVSHYSNGFGQRLFWTDGDGVDALAKSTDV